MKHSRHVIRGIAFGVTAALALMALHGCVRWSRSLALAKASEPFMQNPDREACARVLVVGDSTAVGTGAADPGASIAGRIGAVYARARILNQARDGARVVEIAEQIGNAAAGNFDLVLIQAGGNDVLRFTPLDRLARDWRNALTAARARTDTVVVMHAGNVGIAPIFFPPLSWIYSWRAGQARERVLRITDAAGATFIDLFYSRDDDPFLADPQRYYAADGLHPSSDGYGLWFELLRASGVIERALAGEAGACAQRGNPRTSFEKRSTPGTQASRTPGSAAATGATAPVPSADARKAAASR